MTLPLVMVVDDDDSILQLMAELLTGEGYLPLLVATSAGAAGIASHERPALMLLDMRMEQPDSGMRVLGELRANPDTAGLPVAIFTADRRFLQEHEADLRAQGYGVIAKPFEIDSLFATIRALIARSHSAPSAPK